MVRLSLTVFPIWAIKRFTLYLSKGLNNYVVRVLFTKDTASIISP